MIWGYHDFWKHPNNAETSEFSSFSHVFPGLFSLSPTGGSGFRAGSISISAYTKVGAPAIVIHGVITTPSLGIQSPCQMMIGMYNHLLSKVFRFHYHSEKVIGSLGLINLGNWGYNPAKKGVRSYNPLKKTDLLGPTLQF